MASSCSSSTVRLVTSCVGGTVVELSVVEAVILTAIRRKRTSCGILEALSLHVAANSIGMYKGIFDYRIRMQIYAENGLRFVISMDFSPPNSKPDSLCVRPLLIIGVERDYLRGAIVWSHL